MLYVLVSKKAGVFLGVDPSWVTYWSEYNPDGNDSAVGFRLREQAEGLAREITQRTDEVVRILAVSEELESDFVPAEVLARYGIRPWLYPEVGCCNQLPC